MLSKSPSKRQKYQRGKLGNNPVTEHLYRQLFEPVTAPAGQLGDEENYSLDQPSPYKWVQTETTYGIDVDLCITPNA